MILPGIHTAQLQECCTRWGYRISSTALDLDLLQVWLRLFAQGDGVEKQTTPNAFANSGRFDKEDRDVMTLLYVNHSHDLAIGLRDDDAMVWWMFEYDVADGSGR